jgi:hypothetical protein
VPSTAGIIPTYFVANDLRLCGYAAYFIASAIAAPGDQLEAGIAVIGLIAGFGRSEADSAADRKGTSFGEMRPKPFYRWTALGVLGRSSGVRKAQEYLAAPVISMSYGRRKRVY